MKWLLKIPGAYRLTRKICFINDSVNFCGIRFPNRVGLAAGMDKNAAYLKEMSALGFGFVEIGTVTPFPQKGNPKPRLFRLKKDECLINRMGFNNDGVDAVAMRLQKKPKNLIVGGNIGKNKDTPNHLAVNDYEICFKKLYHLVDYFVVNVSSPNTPNLRALQDKKPLSEILSNLVKSRKTFTGSYEAYKPILLKIAPDLSENQIDDVIEIVKTTGIDGIVATNTTIARNGLKTDIKIIEQTGAGGLSGKVLNHQSNKVISYIKNKTNNTVPIIGVGGIHDEISALEKIKSGAQLIQLYTGFVYNGPLLIKRIAGFLKKQLHEIN